MDDWELLHSYAEGSEAAFADLLRQHIDAVYSTAIRRVRDPQLAQDITQRVFCLLARKASSLPPTGSLIGWLHRTACHLASEALRNDRRRRDREEEAARLNPMTHESVSDNAWQEIAPHLDEALLQLPEPDRLALLLRFFQRLSLRDVGHRLGVTEAAAKMRVGRAVMKLRQHLGAQGITLTAGALAWLLTDRGVIAAPATCAAAVKSAIATLGTATTVSPLTSFLAIFPKITVPAAVVAGLLMTVGTVALVKRQASISTAAAVEGIFTESSEPSRFKPGTAGADGEPTTGVDPLDDPEQLERAIAHLRDAIREPFSRRVPKDRLQEAILALGKHSRAAVPMVMTELRDALKPGSLKSGDDVSKGLRVQILAVETLRQIGPEAGEAIPELLQMMKAGKYAGLDQTVVGLFSALKPSPEIITDLVDYLLDPGANPNLCTGNVIVSLLEQHPSALPSVIETLQSGLARVNSGQQLLIAMTLARLDGSDPNQLRPVLEKHLLLPELRDPAHYLPVTTDSDVDMTPVQQRMIDDQTRRSAVSGFVDLGAGGQDSIPALMELAKRTTDSTLRDEVLRAIGTIAPEKRFDVPEVGTAWAAREADNDLADRIKSGSAGPDEVRAALKGKVTVDIAAAQIATLGDGAREYVPDLLDALNHTGSFEAAQALKKLAPDQLVRCLQNPNAFTPEEPIEFKANPAHDALSEAAQALGELGADGSFALPALRAALEIPDKQWLRLTLEKAIHDIDPRSPVSVFTGHQVTPASSALIAARNEAEQAGNTERARLAEQVAQRIEFNHGMTRRELLTIADELQSADPQLYAVYAQALCAANPSLRESLTTSP